MADAFRVLFGKEPRAADAQFYGRLASLEVEENADLPGAIQLVLPVAAQGAPGSEDLTQVGDPRFGPYARVAVVATPDGKRDACIFDGYVLSHKIHLDRGTTAATLRVWGQDVTCLMNLKEVVKEWPAGQTDGNAANGIFDKYGFAKAEANDQAADDSPKHTEALHTLMQRATDAQFLRDRARRNGKIFRVCCGEDPGQHTGYFIKPDLGASPTITLVLNPPAAANVQSLDFEWDVARPTKVLAKVLVDTKNPEDGGATDSGLPALDSRSLLDFTGGDSDRLEMEARLTTVADSREELAQRAASLLREAGWFVRCEGETDLARLKAVLRAATVVRINGAGKLHSGNYFVWSVRHTITTESHRMRFVLVRNAVGGP